MSITEALNVLGPGTEIPSWEVLYVLFIGFGAATLLVACFKRREGLVTFMVVMPTGMSYILVLILAPAGLGGMGYIATAWYLFVMMMAATVLVLYPPPAPRGNFLY